MHHFLRTPLLILLFLGAVLPGCSVRPSTSPYYPLRESGIQILSGTNPYHGPNLLLGKTIQESETVAGYFFHRGAPQAIEVRNASNFKDELLFYYPEDYQVYVATRTTESSEELTRTDWMIAGPYGIGKHDLRRIRNFTNPQEEAPVFLVNGVPTRYRYTPRVQKVTTLEPEIPLVPEPPKPAPKKKVVKKKPTNESPPPITAQPTASTPGQSTPGQSTPGGSDGKPVAAVPSGQLPPEAKGPNLDDPNFIPINRDQEALLLSKGYARRAKNGDLLHDVEGNAQILENITDWYTGTARNTPAIREANGFPDSQSEVKKGYAIRIPQALLKITKQMPINHRVDL